MAQKAADEDKAMRPAEDKASSTVVTCYNPACPDYRRPRNDGSKCGCARTATRAT